VTDVLALQEALGVSHAMAQILVRRGLGDPSAARAWLAADEEHDPDCLAGMEDAVAVVLGHVRSGTRITVHGDYDVDGVCATAILVRTLRRMDGDVDTFLPSRLDDGYGLSAATVHRLAARGTRLLVTVDCAITAVEEVAAARAAGLDVVVTDHHAPRADGLLPDAPIVHPVVGGYPCPDLCAAGVAYKLAEALERAAGTDGVHDDLDLVALATVADVVPLRGENRRLVRTGLRALATSSKPGIRALMASASVDPGAVDARAVGFRLAPRINAAGRLYRADAGLELLLTADEGRAAQIAAELESANVERRHTETRMLFEAEAQVAAAGDRSAYVVAGEGWHPGVVGIVASRIAERHCRPAVVVALDDDRGRGSGRSIPAFDLLEGLRAAGDTLTRFGGHRAAAGLEIERDRLDDFREAFVAHAEASLRPEDLIGHERVDAVVSGEELGSDLAHELERLAPFGAGNPPVSLLVAAARLHDAQPMGEGKHVRFSVSAGGVRSRAVAFGTGRVPVALDQPADVTFSLELSEYRGMVEPRLVLRSAASCEPPAIDVLGEPERYLDGVWSELAADLDAPGAPEPEEGRRRLHDRRDLGLAGTLRGLVASGEPVLVVCADVRRRVVHLRERVGGFALCSYPALERDTSLADPYVHVVALDPPPLERFEALLRRGRASAFTHLAWGEPELRFAVQLHEREYALRASLAALYRGLRAAGGARGEGLEAVLRGDGPVPRSPALAGRLLRVLAELDLVDLDRDTEAVGVPTAQRTALERSPAFRAYQRLYEDGIGFLTRAKARAA
jgi:single-stranded-DNA-specific exonuclease